MKKPPHAPQGNYQYDPLNRLIISNTTRRFYQNERIATEIEGTNARRFMAFDAQPLAVQQGQATTLLATDQKTSVLHNVSADGTQACAYTPFGHHPVENGITRLLGYNGEHPEAVTGHYLLGLGYRAYNPVLMRFNSPDSWSPFGDGGINSYAYTHNDPCNHSDPTGHMPKFFRPILKTMRPKSAKPKVKTIKPKKDPYDWNKRFTEKEVKIFKEEKTKWTLANKTDPKGYAQLNPNEQVKLNDFKNLIHHHGLHPANAAKLVGDADYKILAGNQFQFRLSRDNRVTGLISEVADIRKVEIVQAGGHT